MKVLKNLRRNFERFCYKHRNKGIPNLMLYIVIGSGMVYLFNLINGGGIVYDFLVFDKAKILQGQVWRLFSWVFTDTLSINPLLNILFLYFFYRLGSAVEYTIGTFKFNLFYGSGVLLMVGFAMIFCPLEDMIIGNYLVQAEDFTYLYGGMSGYLHLSLVLAYATSYPESRFYIFYIIPIPAWVLALVYLVLTGISVFNLCVPVNYLPHALFPLIGLLNYFLFFGADMHNLIPLSWRAKKRQREMAGKGRVGKTIQFPTNADTGKKPAAVKADYNHKCDVCGRTDVSDPELEFRYCSRCRGYHCYCEDHINNHTHIE